MKKIKFLFSDKPENGYLIKDENFWGGYKIESENGERIYSLNIEQ